MTRPAKSLVRAAQAARRKLADRDTPFIYNEWYVAAFADEVHRQLLARRLLDRRVVLYRKRDGSPVAFEDRCPHRSFPLSRGRLDGDTIVCGYHGFRYDSQGDLVEAPSQPLMCPRGVGVRTYPLVEQGPLIWIYLGAPEQANPRTIPSLDWLTGENWARTQGYLHHSGNYVSVHENLLDLTHLSFLHANTIGTPDYASAPYEVDIGESRFKLLRRVVPTHLSPVWAESTGIHSDSAARIAESAFLSPALHQVTVTFYETALPENAREVFTIKTAHILTPETRGSMHYFVVHGRDFALQDARVAKVMHEGLFAAFREDVEGLGALEPILAEADDEFYEISVASDAPALAMRRYLKARAEAESVGAHQKE